jgi:hypothetical protein
MPPDDASQTLLVDSDTGAWTRIAGGKEKRVEPDGTILIRERPTAAKKNEDPDEFFRNLAEEDLSESTLASIAAELLEGIESDNQSRMDWLQNAAEAIKLLGLKIEPMRSSGVDGAAPLEGMSTAHSPLLLEAVLRGQANASGELLPASGPAKVSNDRPPRPAQLAGPQDNQEGTESGDIAAGIIARVKAWFAGNPQAGLAAAIPQQDDDTLAQALQKDINHYLTTTASEYYPDTKRMLFRVYLFGCEFKKVFNCPIRLRPVSESVPANEVIVNNGATDLRNATRITHRIRMPHSTLIRMQVAGAYRKMKLVEQPSENPDPVERAQSVVAGRALFPSLPADHRHTIMETYAEIDLPGFEHKDEDGDETGLPLPYKVSIDYDTRQVLEVRRDWDQEQPGLPQRRRTFVKFSFVEALGFYGLGLMHLLGNTTNSMTSVWRLLIDALMFGNFPGFLYADSLGKQLTNIFRVPPGAGVPIQLNGAQDIHSVAMGLPYQKPDAVSIQLAEMVEKQGQRLGGTADTPVGEGKQNAPVGTTLALIEQATKIVDAVHKGLHRSQAEELQMLVDRFREDPGALTRFNRRPSRQWQEAEFLQALDDMNIVPASDPNTPSQMHRIMRAVARVQLAAMAPPGLIDYRAVLEATLRTLGDDPEEFMTDMNAPPPAPPAPPMPPADPAKMAELQQKGQQSAQQHQERMAELELEQANQQREQQMRGAEAIVESRDRAADRTSRETVAALRLKTEQTKAQIEAIQEMGKTGQIPPDMAASIIAQITATANPAPQPAPAAQQGFRQPGPGVSPGEAAWTRPI